MEKKEYSFIYEMYGSTEDLQQKDSDLLKEARKMTLQAYAPYSKFCVGAAAELSNGKILGGSNQENASFPAGICAERVLLSSISALYPGIAVLRMAISYLNTRGKSEHPIFPCGICRQSLVEYEQRCGLPIRLILGGQSGGICVIPDAGRLLPMAFSGEDFGK
jgi:cytidine deaminase